MNSINGWNSIEEDTQTLKWRIETFAKNCISGNWNNTKQDYTEKYKTWVSKPENKLTYLDVLCGFERTTNIEVYGFAQGYFNIDSVLEDLEEKGETKIPFKWCYDMRQYSKNFDGCYMQIIKI